MAKSAPTMRGLSLPGYPKTADMSSSVGEKANRADESETVRVNIWNDSSATESQILASQNTSTTLIQ